MLWMARERPEKALELCDQALGMSTPQAAVDDMVARLLSLKATVLIGLGRAPEGLEVAQEAIRACPGSDAIDPPACLRSQARCLAALGRDNEARASLATALSLLESTEYVVERQKLYRQMEGLGMPLPGTLSATRSRSKPSGPTE